ncbi:MAG: hypothetical protein J6I52_03165 [Prevotella sp.]|nr:hypothetical protein [Prevotella sp.]MBP3842446.1 hypothetical protein [Prevotella sp.]
MQRRRKKRLIQMSTLILVLLALTEMCFARCLNNTHRDYGQSEKALDSLAITPDSLTAFMKSADMTFHIVKPYLYNESDTIMSCDSLVGHAVERRIKEIEDSIIDKFRACFTDTLKYQSDYYPIKQTFYPHVIVELNKEDNKMWLLISFGTEEIMFMKRNGTYKKYQMENWKSILRSVTAIVPNDEYLNSINQYHNEQ